MKRLFAFLILLSFLIAIGLGSFSCATDPVAGNDDIEETDTDTDTGKYVEVNHPQDDVLSFDDMAKPPGELKIEEVPMFVSIGFDDNGYSGLDESGYSGGMKWATDFFRDLKNSDESPARVSFFMSSGYIAAKDYESPTLVKKSWVTAIKDGHEIGTHTHSHAHGGEFTIEQWEEEFKTCIDWLVKPFDENESVEEPDETKGIGMNIDELFGFRTPFLEYNDATMSALQNVGMTYDCSIEEGWHWEQNGTNYYWPYDLENGSPGNEILVDWELKEAISKHPGLWEMPVHPVIVPPDYRCEEYGVPMGLRTKMKANADWFEPNDGKITGFDYNLWVTYKMTKAEFLATLMYTLDLRLKGNRAPFMFGAHTDYYSSDCTEPKNATAKERQEAIEEFIEYALSKAEVKIVPINTILDWIQTPESL